MGHQLERWVMKDFVDRFMDQTLNQRLSYNEIEAMEGGKGKNRCRTVEDALDRPNTWPNRWFSSNQTDTEAYEEPHYVYSLWWAAYNFSLKSYDAATKKWPTAIKDRKVADIGGSLFSAFRLLELGAERVLVFNFPNSPQGQIIKLAQTYYGLPIEVVANPDRIKTLSDTLVMKAYLEHIRDVDEEMNLWIGKEPFSGDIIVDNSFCEIAYGHYIPIMIDEEFHFKQETANNAFDSLMSRRGWILTDRIPNPVSDRKSISRWQPGFK